MTDLERRLAALEREVKRLKTKQARKAAPDRAPAKRQTRRHRVRGQTSVAAYEVWKQDDSGSGQWELLQGSIPSLQRAKRLVEDQQRQYRTHGTVPALLIRDSETGNLVAEYEREGDDNPHDGPYQIIMRESADENKDEWQNPWESVDGDDLFDTVPQAGFAIEAMQAEDRANREEWDYAIIEVRTGSIARRYRTKPLYNVYRRWNADDQWELLADVEELPLDEARRAARFVQEAARDDREEVPEVLIRNHRTGASRETYPGAEAPEDEPVAERYEVVMRDGEDGEWRPAEFRGDQEVASEYDSFTQARNVIYDLLEEDRTAGEPESQYGIQYRETGEILDVYRNEKASGQRIVDPAFSRRRTYLVRYSQPDLDSETHLEHIEAESEDEVRDQLSRRFNNQVTFWAITDVGPVVDPPGFVHQEQVSTGSSVLHLPGQSDIPIIDTRTVTQDVLTEFFGNNRWHLEGGEFRSVTDWNPERLIRQMNVEPEPNMDAQAELEHEGHFDVQFAPDGPSWYNTPIIVRGRFALDGSTIARDDREEQLYKIILRNHGVSGVLNQYYGITWDEGAIVAVGDWINPNARGQYISDANMAIDQNNLTYIKGRLHSLYPTASNNAIETAVEGYYRIQLMPFFDEYTGVNRQAVWHDNAYPIIRTLSDVYFHGMEVTDPENILQGQRWLYTRGQYFSGDIEGVVGLEGVTEVDLDSLPDGDYGYAGIIDHGTLVGMSINTPEDIAVFRERLEAGQDPDVLIKNEYQEGSYLAPYTNNLLLTSGTRFGVRTRVRGRFAEITNAERVNKFMESDEHDPDTGLSRYSTAINATIFLLRMRGFDGMIQGKRAISPGWGFTWVWTNQAVLEFGDWTNPNARGQFVGSGIGLQQAMMNTRIVSREMVDTKNHSALSEFDAWLSTPDGQQWVALTSRQAIGWPLDANQQAAYDQIEPQAERFFVPAAHGQTPDEDYIARIKALRDHAEKVYLEIEADPRASGIMWRQAKREFQDYDDVYQRLLGNTNVEEQQPEQQPEQQTRQEQTYLEEQVARIEGWKSPNSKNASETLKKLEADGYENVEQAFDALRDYTDLKRNDYDDAESYSDDRSDAWDSFVASLGDIAAPEDEENEESDVRGHWAIHRYAVHLRAVKKTDPDEKYYSSFDEPHEDPLHRPVENITLYIDAHPVEADGLSELWNKINFVAGREYFYDLDAPEGLTWNETLDYAIKDLGPVDAPHSDNEEIYRHEARGMAEIEGHLRALEPLMQEARKYENFDDFSHDFSIRGMHGRYWHLTEDPNFTIDPTYMPKDYMTGAGSEHIAGVGLMVSSVPDRWRGYFPRRKYAAEIDLSQAYKDQDFDIYPYGVEYEVFIHNLDAVSVKRVMPIEQAMRQYRYWWDEVLSHINGPEDLRRVWEAAHASSSDVRGHTAHDAWRKKLWTAILVSPVPPFPQVIADDASIADDTPPTIAFAGSVTKDVPSPVTDPTTARYTPCIELELGNGRGTMVYSAGIAGPLDSDLISLYCQEGIEQIDVPLPDPAHVRAEEPSCLEKELHGG